MASFVGVLAISAGCGRASDQVTGDTSTMRTTATASASSGVGGASASSGVGGASASSGVGGASASSGVGGASASSGVGGASNAMSAATGAGGAGGTTSGGGGAGGAGGAQIPVASLVSRTFHCKLLSGAFLEDPTPNHVQTRFNLKGSDLGVPVASGASLYLFFGDTVGYKGIWDWGEDPDSVAHLPLADVSTDPTKLCTNLDFLVTPDDPSVAHGLDSAILRDFAGAWMSPPPGASIGDFIAQPAGPFSHMPGTFEVPTGGLDVGGKIELFYAGSVELAPRIHATKSYLARWDAPGSLPNYSIAREVDRRVGGALGGHFIQIAPVRHAGSVYLFGTGDYRRSGVYLARLDEAALETGSGQAIYEPTTSSYHDAASLSQAERESVTPLFETEGVGEVSVSYIEAAGLYVALYQREEHAGDAIIDNRIVVRFAPAPEGPWSDPVTITDMADPVFRAQHCCGATCPGDQILHCDKAGLYGAYLLPAVKVANAGGGRDLDLPLLVSTWDPYNVALFSAKVHVTP